MRPVLFQIGSYKIYSYSVMLFIAFIVGVMIVRHELKKRGVEPYQVYFIAAVSALSSLVGGRLFYLVGHWDWRNTFDMDTAGMVFYGGLLFGLLVFYLFVRWMKLPAGAFFDAIGLALPLGIAIARVGCFLNGCCYGKPSGLPWAVSFGFGPVHPTQIYEIILDLMAFAFLLWVRRYLNRDWDLFLMSIASYAVIRFFMEFWRAHADARAGLVFQLMSVAIFVVAVGLLVYRRRKSRQARL
ncbi:MAG: prolipoprotein diacylglyceryl transferase, partial [Actinobacteria bacterium]|nr:prolipoprotein diacylglyceryl transferase [Actinomycetota bacterium]